ncbi:MAG: XdhC family protein [Telluria sp.]
MDSIDLEVLKTAAGWIGDGHRCELVTVVKTWGSSPRPVGATLAICDDGRVVGSVSGGCIEDDLIDKVRREGIVRTAPELVTYGITADEAHRFGLPCGGTIELALEPLGPHSGIGKLLRELEEHRLVARQVNLQTGAAQLGPAQPGMGLSLQDGILTTVHGPRWRLLIIGAGQLSRILAQMALAMDYHVTVCDPREDYRASWNLPGIAPVHAMPDDLVLEMRLDPRSAVVALTHDPKLDDLALMEALKTEAFYVGAIGSRANNARRRDRLKQFDLTDAQIARLHGPIGLYIGSKTPAEIAVSIMAEMTAVKNGVPQELQIQHAEALPPKGAAGCAV